MTIVDRFRDAAGLARQVLHRADAPRRSRTLVLPALAVVHAAARALPQLQRHPAAAAARGLSIEELAELFDKGHPEFGAAPARSELGRRILARIAWTH